MVISRPLTVAPYNHILTNRAVFSPDGQWIVYDVRSSRLGDVFDGNRIERVSVRTGQVESLYTGSDGANVGVASYHPHAERILFIEGPAHPTPDWTYAINHRHGRIVDLATGLSAGLDARNLAPPFTAGALRGGTHLHLFSGDGAWVTYTYDDATLVGSGRAIGVSVPRGPIHVPSTHPRNQDGAMFSALVTRLHPEPTPGSDQISRAAEEAWIGTAGYQRADGTRQARAIAFQGTVRSRSGRPIVEVFIADLPDDPTHPGEGPLQGTETELPFPPAGCNQRRLTFTEDDPHPGLSGPRHWLVSSPEGSQVAFLKRDIDGVAALDCVPQWRTDAADHRRAIRRCVRFHMASEWSADRIRLEQRNLRGKY